MIKGPGDIMMIFSFFPDFSHRIPRTISEHDAGDRRAGRQCPRGWGRHCQFSSLHRPKLSSHLCCTASPKQGSEHRPFGVPQRSRKDGNWSRAEPWFPCSPWWCSGNLTSQVHMCKEHERPCLLRTGLGPYGQHTWHMVGGCQYWLSQVSTVHPVPSASSGKMTKSSYRTTWGSHCHGQKNTSPLSRALEKAVCLCTHVCVHVCMPMWTDM